MTDLALRHRASPGFTAQQFQPGQSGNPRGSQGLFRDLARQIREESGEGTELVRFMFKVLRGGEFRVGRKKSYPKIETRVFAAQWLADRGYGRAKEIVELIDERTPEERRALVRVMTDAERATLRAVLEAAQARLAVDGAAPPVVDDPPSPHDGEGESIVAPEPLAPESPPA